jgi:DivIVA domain-containing protein
VSGDLVGRIHEVRFTPARLREVREGYDMGDVDDFLADFLAEILRSSSGTAWPATSTTDTAYGPRFPVEPASVIKEQRGSKARLLGRK